MIPTIVIFNNQIVNSPVCKSKEEIQEKLHRNYILFQLSSYNIDLRNYLKPNVPKVEEIQTTISSQVMKDITLFMQPITILTEEGLLDEQVRKDSTIITLSQKILAKKRLIYKIYNITLLIYLLFEIFLISPSVFIFSLKYNTAVEISIQKKPLLFSPKN